MGRPGRLAIGGFVYHVLNRANARMRIFESAADYAAFERVLADACDYVPMRVLAYCIMPNHWHLVLRPHHDGDLSRFTGWLTLNHTKRWHAHRGVLGSGHLYQGRFKSFPVQEDEHFLAVCRYVERNALRARLVQRAEDWRWSSLWRRRFGDAKAKSLLAAWPVRRPRDWCALVNQPQTDGELAALRRSANRGCPFGGGGWVTRTADRFKLLSTLRPSGRRAKTPSAAPSR